MFLKFNSVLLFVFFLKESCQDEVNQPPNENNQLVEVLNALKQHLGSLKAQHHHHHEGSKGNGGAKLFNIHNLNLMLKNKDKTDTHALNRARKDYNLRNTDNLLRVLQGLFGTNDDNDKSPLERVVDDLEDVIQDSVSHKSQRCGRHGERCDGHPKRRHDDDSDEDHEKHLRNCGNNLECQVRELVHQLHENRAESEEELHNRSDDVKPENLDPVLELLRCGGDDRCNNPHRDHKHAQRCGCRPQRSRPDNDENESNEDSNELLELYSTLLHRFRERDLNNNRDSRGYYYNQNAEIPVFYLSEYNGHSSGNFVQDVLKGLSSLDSSKKRFRPNYYSLNRDHYNNNNYRRPTRRNEQNNDNGVAFQAQIEGLGQLNNLN